MGLGVCSALRSARANIVSGLFDFIYSVCLDLRVFSATSVRKGSILGALFQDHVSIRERVGLKMLLKPETGLPPNVCVAGIF